MVGLVGIVGQAGFHAAAERETASPTDHRSLGDRLASSKWIPLKSLSDTEYENILTERLVRAEAEISIIDEQIAVLRRAGHAVDSNKT